MRKFKLTHYPETSAVVVSLKTPYYGVSDRKGTIVIPNVPPGRYEMQVWHERVLPETLSNLTRSVLISETASGLGVLHLPEQRNVSQTHKNKYGQDSDNPAAAAPIYARPQERVAFPPGCESWSQKSDFPVKEALQCAAKDVLSKKVTC